MKNLQNPNYNQNPFLLSQGTVKYTPVNEKSSHAYIICNSNGNILEANQFVLNMFGYSNHELLSLNLFKLINPVKEEAKLNLEKSNKLDDFTVQTTGIKKNGEQFPILITSFNFTDVNGAFITSTRILDLSKQKSSKTNLKCQDINNPEITTMIKNISAGFFTFDNDWNITFWDNELEKMFGIRSNEIVGRSFLDVFKKQEILKLFTICQQAKNEHISIQSEEFFEPSKTWIDIHAFPSETGLTVFCKNINDQKTIQEEILFNNERYDLAVKSIHELIWDWNIITGEIYRNKNGLKRVYGYDTNEPIKTNELWLSKIHPDDKENVEKKMAFYLNSETETFCTVEYRFKRADGIYNDIHDKGYIIRNKEGKVIRMIGAARDITEQKQIARNIEESENRYKIFVQQSTEGIWRIELPVAQSISTPVKEMINYCMENAYVAECNDTFAKTYGFENAAKIIGIPLSKIMPADNPVNYVYLEKFFSNNFKVEDEISYEAGEDVNKQVFINNMIGVIEDGHIKRAWGTQRNITHLKKAEQLLLASEEQYRYLFNNNPSSIFIWDLETLKFIEANEASIELYGYSREEFLTLNALDIRPVEDHAKFLDLVNKAKQKDYFKNIMTWIHTNKNGESIYMEITSQNIFYKGKKAILAIGNNVTDKVHLEISLNEEREFKHKQITDAVITGQERERSDLGEELHDNINQILASTRLYIECALTDENPRKDLLEKGKFLLDSAMQEIRSLSRTLLPPSLGEISLIDALNELSKDMLLVNPININMDWVDFNESGLNQKQKLTIFRIVQEQMNNIYKHSHAKNVLISLKKNEDHINLLIKDDGIGFDTSVKRPGVGLRNIMSRAEVNNGTVTIESKPDAGCSIFIRFLLTE